MKYNERLKGSLLEHGAGRVFATPQKNGNDEVLKDAISKAVAEIEAVFAESSKKFDAAKRADKASAAQDKMVA